MIPIELTLQGLYSYKEKQTIDFKPLIDAGLFGLFGPVGSGKSSILEAIMLALFNKTERLSQIGRNYNIMNLQSNELFIDFSFYAGLSSKEKFRTTYVSKRNSKNFEDVSVKERNYYQWDGNQWMPLEIDDASSILGMSYENFMKTIIIPQGKFRDFVDQTTSARTQMLKDLFPLEQFDLYSKTNKLLVQTKGDIQAVEKVLEELGELGPDEIISLESEIELLTEKLNASHVQLLKLRKEEEKLRALEKLFSSFYETAAVLDQLKSESDFFNSKAAQLNTYTRAYTYFKEKLSTLKTYTLELKVKKVNLEELQYQAQQTELVLNAAREKFNEAKEDLVKIEETKSKCDDLKVIIEIGKLHKLAKQLKNETDGASDILRGIQEELKLSKQQLNVLDEAINNLENDLQDVDVLRENYQWLEKERELLKEKHEHIQDLEALKIKFAEYNAAIQHRLESESLAASEAEVTNPLLVVEQKKQGVQQFISVLQDELVPLQVKQQLSNYVNSLSGGEPCPLCGSTHHPDVAEPHLVSHDIEEIELRIKKLKADESRLQQLEKEIHNVQAKKSGIQDRIGQNQIVAAKIEAKIVAHISIKSATTKPGDSLAAVKEKLSEKLAQKDILTQKKALREKIKALLQKQETACEEKRNYVHELSKKQTTEEAKIGQMKQMLKKYEYHKFEKHTIEELSASLQRGLKYIEALNKAYEESAEVINKTERDLSSLKGQLISEEKAVEELLSRTESLDKEIQTLLVEKEFVSIQQVSEILKMSLNIERERQEIDAYRTKMLQVEQQCNSLKKEINNREYTPEHHQEIIGEMTDLEEEIKRGQADISLKNREIEEIRGKMERKNQLFEEQHKLELRKHNLTELCNLFRGNGFMNYVSSIYLNNLCKAANERFLLLTKNNLSLELNEQNDFIVRDYLNNGKTRLLKTLSGGQTFQASLCLALALAENVKALNQADQSFFFLDEGFGALDKNALRVVFDTLKTLRKENRIVGIISHVEELQQEIDVYLEVENDRDKGSIIISSWK